MPRSDQALRIDAPAIASASFSVSLSSSASKSMSAQTAHTPPCKRTPLVAVLIVLILFMGISQFYNLNTAQPLVPNTNAFTAKRVNKEWLENAKNYSSLLRARKAKNIAIANTNNNNNIIITAIANNNTDSAMAEENRVKQQIQQELQLLQPKLQKQLQLQTRNDPVIRNGTIHNDTLTNAQVTITVDEDHKATKNKPVKSKSTNNKQQHLQECRYEGHCPIGTTCGVSTASNSSLPGICEQYHIPSISIELPDSDPCIQQCFEELKWDEQFYFDSKVNVEHMWASKSPSITRPDGCVIQYYRTPQTPWKDFNIDAWKLKVQHHHVVRVDPVKDEKERQAWRAFCYAPCKQMDGCGTPQFQCSNNNSNNNKTTTSQCVPTPEYWTPTNATKHDMVIITGATSSYFHAMQNLVASCQYWAPEHSVVIYNLGLSEQELTTASSWSNVIDIKWRNGFPQHFPDHVRVGKVYGWKPVAMNESVHEYGNIFWLDAGNTLTGPIDAAERIVHNTGIFLVRGQDSSMNEKSHPLTYEYFGYQKSTFENGPHYSGNTQAYLYPSRYVDTIIKPNAACAMDPACVTPKGSDLNNHRYDQTTLSVLTYQKHIMVPARTEYLAADRTQLNGNLMNPSFMFVWTARGGCSDYSMWRSKTEKVTSIETLHQKSMTSD